MIGSPSMMFSADSDPPLTLLDGASVNDRLVRQGLASRIARASAMVWVA